MSGEELDDAGRATERRVTVALVAIAIVLYAGVIPAEVVWRMTEKTRSGVDHRGTVTLARR